MLASGQESSDKPRHCVEKQRQYSADRGPYIQGSGLPVVTCGCENWTVMKVWGAKESTPLNCGAGEDS